MSSRYPSSTSFAVVESTYTSPALLSPVRPARPAIWLNWVGCSLSHPMASPWKTTVCAGRLTPAASVEVAHSTSSCCLRYAHSMTAFSASVSPEWW